MSQRISQDHQLQQFEDDEWTGSEHAAQSLPRVDGGKQAYLFLAACFMLEGLVWGFPWSYGVFQEYYSKNPLFSDGGASIAAIGTTQTGLMYFSAPIVAIVFQRWPQLRRPGMFAGSFLIVLSLIIASFANNVQGLLATQGVVYAIGGILIYFPSIQYIEEWFVAKRGLAYGVMWAGTGKFPQFHLHQNADDFHSTEGSAGVIVPFILQWLLNSYGFRTALRAWAIVLAIGLIPCLLFVKGRLPVTTANALRPTDLAFLKWPSFWFFEIGAILHSLGFFVPSLWLPSFAASLELPKFSGPLGLALINLATCFGAIFTGMLVDRYHVSTAIAIVTCGQIIATFVFWGLTSSQPMLYVFALVWGLFGGGFASTWSGYAPAMKQSHPSTHVDIGLVLSLMAAGRGIGAVISGPLSEKLLNVGWQSSAGFAYGTAYGVLIVFTGIMTALGGTACIGRLLRLI